MTKIENSKEKLDITFKSLITSVQITKFVEDQYIPYRIYEDDKRFDEIPKTFIYEDYMNGKPMMGGKDKRGRFIILEPTSDDLMMVEEFNRIEYCRDLLIRIKLLQQDIRKKSIRVNEKMKISKNLKELISEFHTKYSIDVSILKGKKLGEFILDHFKIDFQENPDFNQVELVRNFQSSFNVGFSETKVRNAIRSAIGRK